VSTNGHHFGANGNGGRAANDRSPAPKRVVIVGGGIAGQSLCERLRERDSDVQVTLVCAEPHLPYDRVHLSDLLSDEEPSGPLGELQLRPDEWYDDNGVEVLVDTKVERIDLPGHELELSNGDTVAYDKLALAIGSQPLMPPIPGIDLEGVYAYRGPTDTAAIRAAAAEATHAAVIGGGLLGLEAARGVQAQGCPVTVVHLMDRLMERQLDAGAASMLLPAMEELDMEVSLERQTEEILADDDGHVRGLRFSDGEELAADLVAVSIGIRPEKELAEHAGIDCNRGIIVDDRLCTSEPDVVALGECAEHRGVVYGIVAPIYEHAKVAADTLLERDGDEYRGSLPWAKLKVAEVDLVSIGDVEGDGGATSALAERREYRKIAMRDGRMVGAILLGDTRGTEALLEAVRSGERVDDPLARLAEAAEAGPEELPDEAQVCDCNGVCKGDIVRAVTEDGMSSKQEVMSVTRAGTGCGSCKPLVADIVAIAGGSDEPAYLCPCRKQTREFVAEQIMSNGHDAVSEVSEACGTGRECGLCKPALAYLVSQINDNRHREERSARHINDRVHANIQNDGTFSVVPRMRGGVTNSDQLRRIADAADKYDVGMIKVTGGQRIDLLGVKKDDLPAIWEDIGMPSGHAYGKAVRQVKSCVGTDFCRFGLGDSIKLGVELEGEWEGLHTPAKVKSGVSGCPRNCAEATVKDIGVVAIEGGWQVYVGGAAGGSVRKGDVIATVETAEESKRVATAFLQYYREHASFKERTYDFVPRVGLEELQEQVLDEDNQATLLERFRLAKTAAAARDPWLERRDPYHERQFTDLDSIQLPQAGGNGANGHGDEPGDSESVAEERELELVGPPPEGER
jgi:nitrite reductase (NADH) large subunit